MSKYLTPSPWPLKGEPIRTAKGAARRVRIMEDGTGIELVQLTEDDYRRAAICVNYCDGIDDGMIIQGTNAGGLSGLTRRIGQMAENSNAAVELLHRLVTNPFDTQAPHEARALLLRLGVK